MAAPLKLISHKLCPYVQRAVIALTEKGVAVRADRYRSRQQAGLVSGDLSARQDAGAAGRRHRDFRVGRHSGISGGNAAEAAASGGCAWARAEHRAWIEFGSAVLQRHRGLLRRAGRGNVRRQDVATRAALRAARGARRGGRHGSTARSFSLVDAVFGPVFRYFDVFDEIADFGILADKPKLARWRKSAGGAAVGAHRGQRGLSGAAARFPRPAEFMAVTALQARAAIVIAL